MKLIIDIQDFVYNHIKEFNSTQLYELNVITAIKNGTPLEEELEKIKEEFEDKILLNQTVAIQIIDKYIAELKGDNNELYRKRN